MNEVIILSREQFIDKILHKVDEIKDTFFISILEPDDDFENLHEDTNNFKTWKFYDVEYDIDNYKAITFEQAKEIYEFIKKNEGKKLIVHCYAGVSRSGAIGEFYWEMLGGSYKQLMKKFPNISPNGRVLSYLRVAEKMDYIDDKLKTIFV